MLNLHCEFPKVEWEQTGSNACNSSERARGKAGSGEISSLETHNKFV